MEEVWDLLLDSVKQQCWQNAGMASRDVARALLDAVDAALGESAVSSLSLRDVARRAGVSHAAPAHFFGNKAGLLTAFAVRGFDGLTETVTAEVGASSPEDGPSTLAAIGRGYVRFAIAEPSLFEVMFRSDVLDVRDAALTYATQSAYALLTSTVEQCALEGALTGRDPAVVTVAAWSIVHGLATLWTSGWLAGRSPVDDPNQLAALVGDLFVDAVMRGR
jgi:AcrR family transcriptional regulator